VHEDGRDFRSSRYQVNEAAGLLVDASRRAAASRFPVTTNPCGEIALHVTGGYCVIADFAPLLACPVPLDDVTPGQVPADLAAEWDARVEDSVRLGVRFLMRANGMDALYGEEVARTNRMGIGPTGLHEYAWLRFGLDFNDMLDNAKAAAFWAMMAHLSDAAKQEGRAYADVLGRMHPVTVTTVKPAGTTSKLFGLTEGAHLPARRQYLRWVQFKGVQDSETGAWAPGSDPLLAEYAERGYPMRTLKTFPGMTVVGFPTVPLLLRLGMGERSVTAGEASPGDQYRWLRLLEEHWIGASQGNQVSYTLKIFTDRHDLDSFREIVREQQPLVRCCAVLPSRPDHELGYEYLPEEEVSAEAFAAIVQRIGDGEAREGVDLVHLQCASGVCPIL
jgi:ribonucleoside-triphosphate reductase (formate)